MTQAKIRSEYFNWMLDKVCFGEEYKISVYHMLLLYLYERDFVWVHPMDENRQEDGIDLRYRFGQEMGYNDPMISSLLDDRPCSILEMMSALAIRCEEQFAHDPDYGDRTSMWFWEMINSLGLSDMDDEHFDINYVSEIIDNFLDRNYAPNGLGGLFTLKHPPENMKNVEIWYQMCYYLNENL